MKKILVLGSQGYLGTRLTRYLKDCGYFVNGVDLGTFANCLISDDFIETLTITKDASSISKWDLEKYDVLINLASNSNDPISKVNPETYYKPAEIFSENIAIFCKDLGLKYIFPSSCSIYGVTNDMCDEISLPNPITEYSKSKLHIESKLQKLANQDFAPVALRLATIFGYSPRMRFDIVVNMFTGMLLTQNKILLNSNGMSWRPHLFIDDALEAFRCVLEWNNNSGKMEIFNVGNNFNNLTIYQTAELMTSLFTGSTIEYLNPDINNLIFTDTKVISGKDERNYRVGFDKIYRTFPDYKNKTSLLDGVTSMIKELKRVNLDFDKFKDKKFYRLHYLENY